MRIRYNVTKNGERWFLKAYNWATASFSYVGFNVTEGQYPALGEWNEYAIIVMGNWADYVNDEGVVRMEFSDAGLSTEQTVVGVDFFGVRALTGGAVLTIENASSLTIHIVAVWINDATHQRYPVDWFLNSGENTEKTIEPSLPQGAFVAKIVTERGNVAVFSSG
jgi:hypothetical protein